MHKPKYKKLHRMQMAREGLAAKPIGGPSRKHPERDPHQNARRINVEIAILDERIASYGYKRKPNSTRAKVARP